MVALEIALREMTPSIGGIPWLVSRQCFILATGLLALFILSMIGYDLPDSWFGAHWRIPKPWHFVVGVVGEVALLFAITFNSTERRRRRKWRTEEMRLRGIDWPFHDSRAR